MRVIREFDPWSNPLCTCPPKYTLNPITGCGHKCAYCYITSYIKDAFNPRIKRDVVYNTERDLRRLPRGAVIAISYSSDPYSPPEDKEVVMRPILRLMKNYGMNVLIATKSNLVTRDIDILKNMNAVVSISITTLDEEIAGLIEPNAPPPEKRLEAIKHLVQNGIPVSLRIDPIIPFLTDDMEDIERLIKKGVEQGVRHLVVSIYKAKPDNYRRLIQTCPWIKDELHTLYYGRGKILYGYRYPPEDYRRMVLTRVKAIAKKYSANIGFNVCREGLDLDEPSVYCDASHLLGSTR